MKWTTWILFAIALVVVTGVLAMVTRQSTSTPEDFFAAVQKRMSAGRYDREQAVQNLDQVLERAQASGNADLTARVLLLRGQTLRELGAYDRARSDLLEVAAMRPADLSVEDDLVQLEARAGDFHAALARVQRMLDRDPTQPHAHVLLGRLHRQAGDKALDRGRETLEHALVSETSTKAVDLLESSAALDPADPRRVAAAHQLRNLLRMAGQGKVEEVLDTLDAANRELDAARTAWIDSLGHGVEPEALAGLVDLFARAGQTARAADLATVAVRMPSMRSDPLFARTLMHALAELGRWRYASEIAATWVSKSTPVSGDFLLECCDVLWRARKLDALVFAGNKLLGIGTTPQVDAAYLYIGLYLTEIAATQDAAAARATWQSSLSYLQRFTATAGGEPFRGGRAEAWKRIARASRELGDPVSERSALIGYVQLEPQGDGEAWLRLAELELAAPNAPYRESDLHFARGMALLPERTAELLTRWNDLGTLELRSLGIDIEGVRAELQQSRPWTPPGDSPPYVRYRLAEMHAAVGDWVRAGAHVRNLLDQVPGFVPALDIAIRIAHGQDKKRDLTEAIVERVRRAGRTPEIEAILHETGMAEVDTRDLLALMRSDPEGTGRLALANGLAAQGHPAQALALLSRVGAQDLGDDGKLLTARLDLDQRKPAEALEVLSKMEPEVLSQADGFELYIRAALDARDRARLMSLVATLARRLLREGERPAPGEAKAWPFDRARALRIADMLLSAGEGDAAHPILFALDSARRLRGGDVLLRLVAAGVLRNKTDDARLALERVRAFESKGAAEFESMLLAAYADDEKDLPARAAEVEVAGYVKAPLARVQSRIVQGHAADARSLVDSQLSGDRPRDPWWNLMAAAVAMQVENPKAPDLSSWLGADAGAQAQIFLAGADGKADPREAVLFTWAARDLHGIPFARAWLARLEPTNRGDLWPQWISASLDAGQGLDTRAIEGLEKLLARHPGFGPAWELEEEVLEHGERTADERAAFRRRRDEALGATTSVERSIGEARAHREAGRTDEALKAARAALEADAWSLDARVLLAALQSQAGNDLAALATLQEGLGLAPPDDEPRRNAARSAEAEAQFVSDYLATIARLRAAREGALTRARTESHVKSLAEKRPDDPRVLLAQAQLDLDADERSPSMGVMRAYNRLDGFRASHKDVPLDHLAPGSIRAWAQFYARLDPEKAQTFLDQELALDPTQLSTWIELAHAAEAEGDTESALKRLELCARLAPRGDVLREILRLRSLGDIAPEVIEESVRAIIEAEGKTVPDAELVLLQARCYLNLGPRFLTKVMNLITTLQAWRDISREFRVQSSILSATAWMSRGTPDDVKATQQVLQDVVKDGDPYQRAYVRALLSLAHAP